MEFELRGRGNTEIDLELIFNVKFVSFEKFI